MEIVKRLLHRLGKWEYIWLCLLVLAMLAMHFSIITQPAEPVFDEQHYVPDARSILQGDGTLRPEHPSLGKLFIVLGISLFGDNPLGWRFFSILLGTICIVLFYLVCRQLAMSQRASFLATFLLLMPQFDFAVFRQLVNPITWIKTMLSLSSGVTFANTTCEVATRPWDWILHPEIMFYWYEPPYVAAISFTIWAVIIPVVCYMLFRALRGNSASLFGLSWFASTYLVWIPVSIITDRISFVYYFYPTVGAICIGLGLGLSQLLDVWEIKRPGKLRWVAMLAVSSYLVCHVVVFVMRSPVFAQWISLFHAIPPP